MRSDLFKPLTFIVTILCALNCWADFTPEFFKTADGQQIRYAFWPNAGHDKKIVIVLLQGRASFIEKNIDFIEDLTKLGYAVATFDWRGMGGSDRVLDHPHKNHIISFDIYLNDLDQFVTTILKQHTHDQLVLYGASFGGHMALRYLHDHPQMVKGAILSAPLLGVTTNPYPEWFAKPLIQFMNTVGFSEHYVLGHGDFDPRKSSFESNKETNDKNQYLKTLDIIHKYPQYVIGGVTYGWINAAYDSLNLITAYTYLQNIHLPVLLISAEDDQVVDNSRDAEYCHEMPKCSYKNYVNAAHHLAKEIEPVRTMLIHDIDHFISNIDAMTK